MSALSLPRNRFLNYLPDRTGRQFGNYNVGDICVPSIAENSKKPWDMHMYDPPLLHQYRLKLDPARGFEWFEEGKLEPKFTDKVQVTLLKKYSQDDTSGCKFNEIKRLELDQHGNRWMCLVEITLQNEKRKYAFRLKDFMYFFTPRRMLITPPSSPREFPPSSPTDPPPESPKGEGGAPGDADEYDPSDCDHQRKKRAMVYTPDQPDPNKAAKLDTQIEHIWKDIVKTVQGSGGDV